MDYELLLNYFLIFTLGIFTHVSAEIAPTPRGEEFSWGIVFIPNENNRDLKNQVADMQDLGVTHAKWWMDWGETERTVLLHNLPKKKVRPAPAESGYSFLTCQDVEKHKEIIEEYAHPEDPKSRFHGLVDWSSSDQIITLLNDHGIEPVPLIGDATTAPWLKSSDTETLRIAPEPEDWEEADEIKGARKGYSGIGREAYLGHILLYTAAASRRYQKGSTVTFWNTENELNWTHVHVSEAGWRKGEAWKDQKFLTELLATLHKGIHLGNPRAQTTMNINIHDPGWEKDLVAWRDLMDIIGLGAYPNYLFSKPVLGKMVGTTVSSAVALSKGKPVIVMETGYPTGPKERGWGETGQVEYIREAIWTAREAGAAGFFYFRLDDAKETSMTKKVQAVESHWGLVDVQGKRKPAFFVYQQIIRGHEQENRAGQSIKAWVCDPCRRINRETVPSEGELKANAINIFAGKNEYIGRQIALFSKRKLTKLSLQASDLVNLKTGSIISSENIKTRFVGYASIPEKDFLIADAWREEPITNLEPNICQPVWLTFYIPKTAASGDYRAAISIKAPECEPLNLEVNLRVAELTLPDPRDYKFCLEIWQHPYVLAMRYGVELWSERHWKLIRAYTKELASLGQKVIVTTIVEEAWRIIDPNFYPWVSTIKWFRKKSGKLTFDYTIFDRYVNLCMEEGIDELILCHSPILMMGEMDCKITYFDEEEERIISESYKPLTAEYKEIWSEFLKDFINHLQTNGWLEKTYLGFDEAKGGIFKQVVDFFREETGGKLKIATAFNGNRREIDEIDSYIDRWSFSCAKTGIGISPGEIENLRKTNDNLTWYVCCFPLRPNTFIFSPLIESRLLPWLTYEMKMDGLLRWSFNYWSQKLAWHEEEQCWINVHGGPWPSGDLFLVYPGKDGPLSSLRWEALRQGIQDYEYLRLLDKKITQMENLPASEELLSDGQIAKKRLRQAVCSVVGEAGFTDYTQDCSVIEQAKKMVIETLLWLESKQR